MYVTELKKSNNIKGIFINCGDSKIVNLGFDIKTTTELIIFVNTLVTRNILK